MSHSAPSPVSGLTQTDLRRLVLRQCGDCDPETVEAFIHDSCIQCACCGETKVNRAEVVHPAASRFSHDEHVGWFCGDCDPTTDDDYRFDASFDERAHHSTHWGL
jgi:hypothetical protein